MLRISASLAVVATLATVATWSSTPSAQTHPGVTLAIAGRSNQTPWVAARDAFVAVAWIHRHQTGAKEIRI